jgi:hypothetical protein
LDHRATSLDFLKMTGLIPVKVRPNQKDPFSDWSPNTAIKMDIPALFRQIEHNKELNIGGLFHGRYVDLDEDCTVPTVKIALDMFMPKTPWIWGRKSKPRSHRCFVLHEDFNREAYGPLLRFLKALKIGTPTPGWDASTMGDDPAVDSYSVELRGGKPENGFMTVLPGSYRADFDEHVEWSAGVDTSVSAAHVPAWFLVKRLRLAIATALLATYFTDGVRNDMSLAIAGLLWRIRRGSLTAAGVDYDTDLPEDYFILQEADADEIFKNLLAIADPNHSDRRQRELNYINTWTKLNNDPQAKVTGGKVLAQLIGMHGEAVVKAMYRLLSDNEGIEEIERLAEQYVVWSAPGVLVDLLKVERGSDKVWQSREAARNSIGWKKVKLGNKMVSIVNLMFDSGAVQRIEGLTFEPSTPERLIQDKYGQAFVNEWKGFEVEPHPEPVSDEEMKPFISYVTDILANGETEHARWVFSWVADLFQQPGFKPGTTLVLIGVQGAGKSFLGERIIGRIIGERHYAHTNDVEGLTSKFNQIADNKIFIQCDEATHSYQRGMASKLKSLITDERITIEPKGINSFQKPNHIHYLFTSNNKESPIFIDPSPHERRFMVLNVSPEKATDLTYWTAIRDWTERNITKIARWLLDYKYDKAFIRRPLQTAAKRAIQRQGVDPEVSWILNRIGLNFPLDVNVHTHWWHAFNTATITDHDKVHDSLRRDEWPDRVSMPILEADFKSYIRQHGKSVYSGSVISVLRAVFPDGSLEQGGQISVNYSDPRTSQTVKERVRIHKFPTKEQIKAHLVEKFGAIVLELIDQSENTDLEETSVPVAHDEEF